MNKPELVYERVGANIKAAYAADTLTDIGAVSRLRRVRFAVRVVTAGGSAMTTVNVKLLQRYRAGGVTLGWVELPSHLDDAQGAAQPKGQTFEVEHAFTVAANQTKDFTFVLKEAEGILGLAIDCKANVVGIVGESVLIYAVPVF
jgi:hypothetical protein